ncbi:MAG: cation diffusion facilitator family transporter [Natronincolaceae bacterium]|jgi:cation diffusion facilitator family transporter|nr:cation diffusion facilitator family transporter [Bacillota bacterium]NLK91329.1 cation transporter [Clostridiales bacterium]
MDKDTSQAKDINKVLIITILINILLLIVKVIAGLMVNSTALIADGLHSGSDVITSVGVIIGVKIAQKPRDAEHHYGHEKVETIATFLLSIVLIYVGAKIGYSAFIAIIQKKQVHFTYSALFIALASVVIKEIQYQIAFRVGTREQSSALIADAWHHRSDALSSIASFVGILGAKYKIYVLDGLAGLAVSIIVIRVGIKIFINCFQQLIDVSIHTDEIENVKNVIINKTDAKNISDMRTRQHGTKVFVDISICVDPDINVQEGHEIAQEVENIIKKEIENVKDVIVHVNPYCYKDYHKRGSGDTFPDCDQCDKQ